MAAADVPEWPGLAGWFGVLLALLWLAEPSSFRGPMPALTLGLLACLGYGLLRHLLAADGLTAWRERGTAE